MLIRGLRVGAAAACRAREPVRILPSSMRCFSTPTEMSEEEIEHATILADMEKMKAEVQTTRNSGYIALFPDLPETLPANRSEVQTLDHTAESVLKREVYIYKKTKSSMTSGLSKTRCWSLHWKHAERWTNPLTGWSSSGDPMTTVDMSFDTKEQAIAFADKKGLAYVVKEPKPRRRTTGTNVYAHNFLPAHLEATLRDEGASTKYFDNAKDGRSNYFRPLKFHGDGDVSQHGPNPDLPY